MNPRESARALHVIRLLHDARVSYIPSRRIKTRLTYFKAIESKDIHENAWGEYCETPIKIHNIRGDHFSIFQLPYVTELVQIVNRIIDDAVMKREI